MPEHFRVPPFEKLVNLYRVLAAITVLVVIYLASAKLIGNPVAKPDLETYLHAASLIRGGNNPYLMPIPAGVCCYVYPPLFAVLFIPVTFLPIDVTVVIWCVLNVLLVGWAMMAFYELLAEIPFFEIPIKTRWTVCFFALLPTFRFIFNHLSFGQSDIVVLALAVLGLVYWARNRQVTGGVAIGFSIITKVISLPLAIWIAAKGNVRVTMGIALGLLAGLLFPALLLGFGKNLEFLDYWVRHIVLYSDLRHISTPMHVNLSLQAQLYRFFSDTVGFENEGKLYYLTLFTVPAQTLHLAGRLIVILVAGTVAGYALKYRKQGALVSQCGGIALAFSLMPLFVTVMQKHHLVLLLPAYIYVVHLWYSIQLKDKVFRALVVASMALLNCTVFFGAFLSRAFAAGGSYALGVLLLSAAIFRAAGRLHANSYPS